MEQEAVYVGIDVAKAQVDVAVRPTGQRWTISNDEPGIRELVSRLRALEPAMVVLEASGGLELPSVSALAAASRQWSSSTPGRFETSPEPRVRWRRLMPWTRPY